MKHDNMSEEEWRAVASQMFILEREETILFHMLNGAGLEPPLSRVRLKMMHQVTDLANRRISQVKSDLEDEMFHQGVKDIDIFYPNARNPDGKREAIEKYREMREKMAGGPPKHW